MHYNHTHRNIVSNAFDTDNDNVVKYASNKALANSLSSEALQGIARPIYGMSFTFQHLIVALCWYLCYMTW